MSQLTQALERILEIRKKIYPSVTANLNPGLTINEIEKITKDWQNYFYNVSRDKLVLVGASGRGSKIGACSQLWTTSIPNYSGLPFGDINLQIGQIWG